MNTEEMLILKRRATLDQLHAGLAKLSDQIGPEGMTLFHSDVLNNYRAAIAALAALRDTPGNQCVAELCEAIGASFAIYGVETFLQRNLADRHAGGGE